MRRSIFKHGLLLAALFAAPLLQAQDIDAIASSEHRTPATITDEILNPSERSAYIALYQKSPPDRRLALAQAFLQSYPQSAFLAQVYEVGARSSFDLGDFAQGLEYARDSLALLPENPLFLVAVCDVQARQHQNGAAIVTALDALDYLTRFSRPVAIAERDWPDLKRHQQASAWFVIGRARIQQAVEAADGPSRASLLEQGASALLEARSLHPGDAEIRYLLAVDYFYARKWQLASEEFAGLYRRRAEFAAESRDHLLRIYNATKSAQQGSFEDFVTEAAKQRAIALPAVPDATVAPNQPAANQPAASQPQAYAGSESCKNCHNGIYQRWSQSGMARMLQPYKPQDVIGDFVKNNEFYAGEDVAYRAGKLEIAPAADRALFARMVVRNGRHYFDIKQSDGRWHTYPVDYVIGSKWQQAYATTLPNKQIHVFPIQYSTVQKKWVNYWKVIDSVGTPRSDPYNFEKFDITTSYQANCAVCHTSQLRNVKGGGLAADNLVFREPGIGCEMCHGPSATHIAAISSGQPYNNDKQPLDPPVEFDRIGNRDFVAICAQCHMQSSLHDPGSAGELNYSSTGTFFLRSAAVPLGEFSRKGFYKDGRISQSTFMVEALERSKCFRQGSASCGSCHNPHDHDPTSNNTSLRFKDQPDLMCVGCHTRYQDKAAAQAHTHHPANSEGGRCVSCHMPRIVDGLLFKTRSHQMDDIPNAEMTLRFGQEESPNACLLCHSEKTVGWVQSQLASWRNTSASGPGSMAATGPILSATGSNQK